MSDHDNNDSAPRRIEAASFQIALEQPAERGLDPRLRLALLVAASAVLALIVVVVIVVLPRWVGTAGAPPAVVAPQAAVEDDAAAQTDSDAEPDAAPEPAASAAAAPAAAREDTQTQLRKTLDKLALLEAIEAEHWAKSELHDIRQRIAEGEKAYREKRYVTANNIYLDTAAAVERLLNQVPDIVTSLIDSGRLALEQGDSAQAANAFEQALVMDSDNADAKRGRARAATLDQVLALIGQAEGYERLDQTGKALTAYREAVALDADAAAATTAINRIERAEREDTYREAMSAGFRALKNQQFGAARAAFGRAAAIDNNRADVKAALKQVDNDEASYHIERHLAAANKAVAAEQWNDAFEQFSAALKYDERLSPALAGKQRAETRRRIDSQLTAYLARPLRLTDEKVHAQASAILAEARKYDDGQRISRQISDLARELELARTPLQVTLLSDNATTVTLYRVSELGQFERRELSLLPGDYTAVGKRDGYRDVRVEFSLRHGQSNAPVTVQCSEQFSFGN